MIGNIPGDEDGISRHHLRLPMLRRQTPENKRGGSLPYHRVSGLVQRNISRLATWPRSGYVARVNSFSRESFSKP
ncbi:MAG: hypothetical protein WCA45_08640, partial [Thiobacillaceae bacterium]